ncbi:hypothetical protein [Polyangium sorediatum]|uniref:Uncharacterized protein n=1 Tax=Polyangium sorediatum TaxID=889274 RepID=A0ABT6NIK6_9BACT|nr:hypothetical protein [Polyangium sorediatum]MDI1428141.1 hypothetical protein [Polyangium sorediatum]
MTQEKPSLFDYLNDPRELHLLKFALNGTLTDRMRLAYAARLEEIDPERAEWLRLEVALHESAAEDPAIRARFAELSGKVTPDWRNLLCRDMILNCGDARAERPRVRFSFVCPARWETLEPTEDASVRFCGQCQERVYSCDSSRVAAVHARAGHCIAVPRELSDKDVHLGTRGVLGRPDPLGDWARDLFPDDE